MVGEPGLSLGIDVEAVQTRTGWAALARGQFAASDAEGLHRLPAPERDARFTELWTLNEAYLKAIGLGVWSAAVGRVSFLVGAREVVCTAVAGPPDVDAGPSSPRTAYDCLLCDPMPAFRLAVVVAAGESVPRAPATFRVHGIGGGRIGRVRTTPGCVVTEAPAPRTPVDEP